MSGFLYQSTYRVCLYNYFCLLHFSNVFLPNVKFWRQSFFYYFNFYSLFTWWHILYAYYMSTTEFTYSLYKHTLLPNCLLEIMTNFEESVVFLTSSIIIIITIKVNRGNWPSVAWIWHIYLVFFLFDKLQTKYEIMQ